MRTGPSRGWVGAGCFALQKGEGYGLLRRKEEIQPRNKSSRPRPSRPRAGRAPLLRAPSGVSLPAPAPPPPWGGPSLPPTNRRRPGPRPLPPASASFSGRSGPGRSASRAGLRRKRSHPGGNNMHVSVKVSAGQRTAGRPPRLVAALWPDYSQACRTSVQGCLAPGRRVGEQCAPSSIPNRPTSDPDCPLPACCPRDRAVAYPSPPAGLGEGRAVFLSTRKLQSPSLGCLHRSQTR